MGFALTIKYKGLPFLAEFPWKISIVSSMAFPRTTQNRSVLVEDLLKILNDSFFDAIEVPSIDQENWSRLMKHATEKVTIRSLQPDILTNKLDMNALDSSERQRSMDKIKSEINLAAHRGIGLVCVCSGPDPGASKRSEARDTLVVSLVEICEYAREKCIRIALETFDRDYDKKLLIGPLDEAAEVVTKVRTRCDNIGLMWDLSHAPLLKETPNDVRRIASLLGHIHIGCAKRTNGSYLDTHPGFYTKGAVNSENDLTALLQVLLDVKYQGMIGFEVKPESEQTSEEIIATSKGVLVGAYQRIVVNSLG